MYGDAEAAEAILKFADTELGKLHETQQQRAVERVMEELRTWHAAIVAGEGYGKRGK